MKKDAKPKRNLLPLLAGAVVLAAAAVTLIPRLAPESVETIPGSTAVAAGSDIVIQEEEIGSAASYFDYDADGVIVQVLAVRALDDTVRLALNTCQVCNGSPYAYFEQQGDVFVCQNCKNRFVSTAVGKASGGCNPIPVTEQIYTNQDGVITIPASFLNENAEHFTNWKQF